MFDVLEATLMVLDPARSVTLVVAVLQSAQLLPFAKLMLPIAWPFTVSARVTAASPAP